MYLTCKCLNVIIKYSARQSAPLELSLPNHEFFRDNSLITSPADDNFAVLKQQPALIDEQVIDTWRITRCINCYQYTHAVTDNPDNSDNKTEEIPAEYLVINKSLITVNNLPSDNFGLSETKIHNSSTDNLKRLIGDKLIPTADNLELSDNLRLVNDNLNSISDNTALMSTKMTLMTDNSTLINDNSSLINDNSRLINDNSITSDKTMIFSDNVPLMSDNSLITADNSLTNSTISIDNSLTSRSITNMNDNSLIISDNSGIINDNLNITSDNLTLVSDNSIIIGDNSTLIGDNSKISAITSDNSTISDDNSSNKNNIFNKMRKNPDYSDIYNIIISNDNNIDDNDILMMRKKLLPSVQLSLGNLQQQYEIKVKNIKDIVEENIKKFIAKQYEYLDNYKERGHQDYCVLSDKILRNEIRKMKNDNGVIAGSDINISNDIDSDIKLREREKTESLGENMSDIVRPIIKDDFIVPGSLIFMERNKMADDIADGKRDMKREKKEGSEKRAKRKQMKKQNSDIDDEVMFAIEGMDDNDMDIEDNNKTPDNEEEDDDDVESDDSGQDEGIHIPRVQRGGHPTLAKSLPVSVPNFSFSRRAQRHNDGQQSMDPLDPNNIRASIKALAKSVHGDTVFGDLPRPRFSTEI